jgi:hypothetical protein
MITIAVAEFGCSGSILAVGPHSVKCWLLQWLEPSLIGSGLLSAGLALYCEVSSQAKRLADIIEQLHDCIASPFQSRNRALIAFSTYEKRWTLRRLADTQPWIPADFPVLPQPE